MMTDETPKDQTMADTDPELRETSERLDTSAVVEHEEREETPEERRAREKAEAKEAWAQVIPWDGKPSRGDKVLLGSMFGITAFYLLMLPVKPFLIAHHPVLLEFVTGSKSAIGAGAAFARIGQAQLWLVVLAGIVGAAKFDWLFWLMGRRWGHKIVMMFAPNERAKAQVHKAEHWPRWVAPLAVFLGVLPGVPAAMAYALAGWQKMRLGWFLLLNVLSTAMVTGLVAWLGYSLGQAAVDVVLQIDKYAMWISLALIFGAAFWNAYKQNRKQKAGTPKN